MKFTEMFRACMSSLEQYKELQRIMSGIDIHPRKRLLLKVIERGLKQTGKEWMPLADVVAAYNNLSLQRLRAGETTIGEDLKKMEKEALVRRQRDPNNQRIVQICLGSRGSDILVQESELEQQRLDLYEGLLNDEQKTILMTFFEGVTTEFNRRISNWQGRFSGKL